MINSLEEDEKKEERTFEKSQLGFTKAPKILSLTFGGI